MQSHYKFIVEPGEAQHIGVTLRNNALARLDCYKVIAVEFAPRNGIKVSVMGFSDMVEDMVAVNSALSSLNFDVTSSAELITLPVTVKHKFTSSDIVSENVYVREQDVPIFNLTSDVEAHLVLYLLKSRGFRSSEDNTNYLRDNHYSLSNVITLQSRHSVVNNAYFKIIESNLGDSEDLVFFLEGEDIDLDACMSDIVDVSLTQFNRIKETLSLSR